ncbi:small ribosomal subunit protein uS11m isoform X3 [Ranitomeya variabilis]|uniref:small ribosomal subunit protein uS11m isoform X3 n=1 Tax=Ranitomeya variabilis TaxID=490064 RepID=UPI004056E2FE
MSLVMRRAMLLPGILHRAWGALGSSWLRPLCVSAQKTLSSSENPISDRSSKELGTHIQVMQPDNKYITRTSCGTEGFRNAKKSSSVAAQTAGLSAATKAVDKGVLHVRVIVKGMGPGRAHAIKGLTMGGLEVISITDNTPIPHNGCRPRKARRL